MIVINKLQEKITSVVEELQCKEINLSKDLSYQIDQRFLSIVFLENCLNFMALLYDIIHEYNVGLFENIEDYYASEDGNYLHRQLIFNFYV